MFPIFHKDLIAELQNIHDNTETYYWRDELENLASKYHLEWKF